MRLQNILTEGGSKLQQLIGTPEEIEMAALQSALTVDEKDAAVYVFGREPLPETDTVVSTTIPVDAEQVGEELSNLLRPSEVDIDKVALNAQRALQQAVSAGTVKGGQVIHIDEWGLTPLLEEVRRRSQVRQQVYQVVQKLADAGHSLGDDFWDTTLREHQGEALRV